MIKIPERILNCIINNLCMDDRFPDFNSDMTREECVEKISMNFIYNNKEKISRFKGFGAKSVRFFNEEFEKVGKEPILEDYRILHNNNLSW